MRKSKQIRAGVRLGLIAVGTIACFAPAYTQSADNAAPSVEMPKDSKLVTGYKKWTKVNPQPVQMQPAAADACTAPFPSQLASPHLLKYITVYVNAIGKKAMTQRKSPQYPVGTILVKEKLAKPDSRFPELLTVMVRHEKGFDEENGDWEYLVFNGAGTQITSQGKMEKCQSCHRERPASDYVFRTYYLPEKLRTALK